MHRSSLEVRLWRRRYGRCSWLLSRAPTPARSASCPSIVEYDVSVFVDFQHRLELAVRNNIRRLRECRGEVNFDAQLAPLHEVETRSVTGLRCQFNPEEGVSVAEVRACQIVSFGPATLSQWSRTGSCNSGRDEPGQSLAGGVSLVHADSPRRLIGSLCRCALRGTSF